MSRSNTDAAPNCRIVLSHPSEPRNVGAVCRAMKNAGLTDLCIVTDRGIDLDAARPLAVGSEDILHGATIVDKLGEAIAGASLVAGTTRRRGQRRKSFSFMPWQVAKKIAEAPDGTTSCIVFGNEQSGLSDAELELCSMAVLIPSSPMQPSLNLSHAVQVMTYELFIASLSPDTGRGALGNTPVSGETLAAGVEDILGSLDKLGFASQPGPQGMGAFLRDILGRSMLSNSELKRLVGLFSKLQGMQGKG